MVRELDDLHASSVTKLYVFARKNTLIVKAPDGTQFEVHPLWLRERCHDPLQVDINTQQRLYNPCNLAADLHISSISAIGTDQFLVRFSDQASCIIGSAELEAELPDQASTDLPSLQTWDHTTDLPLFMDWREIQNPRGQHTALGRFLTYGFTVISNVPARNGAVLEVARCFGFPRETNFGAVFDVRSVPRANDLAYTSLPLDPHTDNPYRAPVPGIQLLHCLINESQGGLSTLVDGLAVSEHLRETDPESFAILTQIEVKFRYTAQNAELVASAPLIELDRQGQFAAINYSPRLDFVPLYSPVVLQRFYHARRSLNRLLTSPMFERRFRLGDGDLMMFDNRRLLHGRTGFDPRTGVRHLQGCYIDADGPRSLFRVLSRDLA